MSKIEFSEVEQQLQIGKSVFPAVVENKPNFTSLANCIEWVKANKEELEAELISAGTLLFRGFPIDSAETFDQFSAAFGYDNFTYKESLSNAVRINFTERVFTANEAPKEAEIYLHHEMAQTPIYPSKLFFFCLSAADQGGATPICRSDALFSELSKQNQALADDFEAKGLKYTTTMPGADDAKSAQGRSWKSTLSVDTVEAAEAKLAELGYSYKWNKDGSLEATTPVLAAVLERENGRKVFFNQLIAAYMGWKGVRENPSSAITFGDGSHISKEDLELVNSLAAQFTFDLQWQDGDVAIIDNYMAMHGRRPYTGDRKRQVLVALAAA